MIAAPFNILLSSAGRRVALLELLRRTLSDLTLPGRVLAADLSRLSSAFQRADQGFLVPPCTHLDFVPALLRLCEAEQVRLIIPTIDTELAVYAAHRAEFERIGTTVAVSSPQTIALCADKVLTHRWLTEHQLPTVRQATPDEVLADPAAWPFPLLCKPRAGSLSKGVTVVRDAQELRWATATGDFIVQSLAPGVEFTIDFLADRQGRLVCAVPRRRLEVRGGEISKGVTVRAAALQDLTARVCHALPGPYGTLNVQVFWDEATGALNVIELNARFGGGYPLSHQAGAHFPRWLIEELLGLPSTARPDAWQDGLVMLRYDEAVYVDSAKAGLRP
jgi:carbamoyl-phosphate synthase large subunit